MMPITAQSSDGVMHQFPDGTDRGVIDRTMKAYAQQRSATAGPRKDPADFTSFGDYLRRGELPGIIRDPIEAGVDLTRRAFHGELIEPSPETITAATAGLDIPASPGGVRPKLPPSVQVARDNGYVLPPSMITERPGAVASTWAGISGKVKMQQAASARNQSVTNELGAAALGLPRDTTLTDSVFEKVRRDAGRVYEDVASALPQINVDGQFREEMLELSGANGAAAADFPDLVNNKDIEDLSTSLFDTEKFRPRAGIDLVRALRFKANANLKGFGGPEKLALGLAQREAANAVDNLIERNLAAAGKPNLVNAYRAARKMIAKSYDLEMATNTANGEIDAHKLGALLAKGRPFEGEMKRIAETANSFPKATQRPSSFGGEEKNSVLDYFGALGLLASNHPVLAAAPLVRPFIRGRLFSEGVQNRLVNRAAGLGRQPPSPFSARPLAVGAVPMLDAMTAEPAPNQDSDEFLGN